MSKRGLNHILAGLLCGSLALAMDAAAAQAPQAQVSTVAPKELKDLYFGEALYRAFQGEWFDAVARLDTELGLFHGLDEPERDTLFVHLDQAEFAVGDFELAYRMHQRAGRAMAAVIEGQAAEPVRNEALFRLARLYFRKDRPAEALQTVERIRGAVPDGIRDDLEFLRAQICMANGRFAEAARTLKGLQGAKGLEGFAGYNLGIALFGEGREPEGRQLLERTGQLVSDDPATLAIKDKANLVLGDLLLEQGDYAGAKQALDRVRLNGPFSNRALLGSGWADASLGQFDRALVPWSLLAERGATNAAVQEARLALPYAYGKLGVYSKAALLYGDALAAFARENERLGASLASIREGHFLRALVREELKQDANWVVTLRELPETPETYYLLELMASHDFQESLRNYLDLEELRRKLDVWGRDLDAFAELIEKRRAYYQPLLPEIDEEFRRLDAQMRLRLEQRNNVARRLKALLTAPRPDALATAEERILQERLARLEQAPAADGGTGSAKTADRIRRLRGVMVWNIRTDYDRRLTAAFENLRALSRDVERLDRQYDAFVRTRQAATQSYQGYDEVIARQRQRIAAARETVGELMERQGALLETMAVNELTLRRERLAEFEIKARFALADSYDRAVRAQSQKREGP